MLVRYKYTRAYRDRHGKLRFEYRRNGKTRRLRGTPGTPQFQAAYDAAHAAWEVPIHPADNSITRPLTGTFRWLCCEYFKSTEFAELNVSTQRVRRLVLESVSREPWTKGSSRLFGDAPVSYTHLTLPTNREV